MSGESPLPWGPAPGDEAGLGQRMLQPLFPHLLPHEDRKRGAAGNAGPVTLAGQRIPFEQASLETFGNGFHGLETENPVVTRQVEVVIRWRRICRDDARSIFARDTPSGIRGVVVNDQDFSAGKKHFERPSQA